MDLLWALFHWESRASDIALFRSSSSFWALLKMNVELFGTSVISFLTRIPFLILDSGDADSWGITGNCSWFKLLLRDSLSLSSGMSSMSSIPIYRSEICISSFRRELSRGIFIPSMSSPYRAFLMTLFYPGVYSGSNFALRLICNFCSLINLGTSNQPAWPNLLFRNSIISEHS